MGDIVWAVVVHRQLFENDLALHIDVFGPQRRVAQHVTENLTAERHPVGREPAVVRRGLLGGERIHVTTNPVDRAGDVLGRTGVGALEEQVLQEV